MKKAAIAACSNAQQSESKSQIGDLTDYLQSIGIEPELSECIYSIFRRKPTVLTVG